MNYLNKFVDDFKLKNPRGFFIVQGVVGFLIFTLGNYLLNGYIKEVTFTIPLIGTSVDLFKTILGALVVLGQMIGAHTPKPMSLGRHIEIEDPQKIDA